MIFALAGNQNCGKTTLFNQLTGSNQHVGNFPGVTVDQTVGVIRKYDDCKVVDLPGIYSIRPYSDEEIVTRDFLINNHLDGIINIIDATNIERNLYLTLQLLELKIPTVVALNMMDEVRNNGGCINTEGLSQQLGVPVVPISASKNEGIEDLIEVALATASKKQPPKVYDFCTSGPVHRCIHAIAHEIEDHAQANGMSSRFAATKIIENDQDIIQKLKLSANEADGIEHSIVEMETESGLDRNAAIADMRYTFIERVCKDNVVRAQESKERIRSIKIDKILTGKYTGIPVFILIMFLVFFLTFNFIGQGLSDLLASFITFITGLVDQGLTSYGINPVVHGLIIDGCFAGVGSVLSFLPIVVTLFFFLSILEDTGYMARVAFIMDKLLRKIGMSGRSIVPLLVGFGCSVPAVMSTRTLSSSRDRRLTIMLIPFMSCSAKIPIYGVFAAAFFANQSWLVMLGLYGFGIIIGIIMALILEKTIYRGNPAPFVMELPNYRFPSAKSVFLLMWEKSKDFLERAFTIIFVASIVVWALQTFDMKLNVVTDSSYSILATLGHFVAPIFSPIGFSDWRLATALITGLTAKEAVVSTLEVLFNNGVINNLSSLLTTAQGLSLAVFTLLYTPCVACIAAIKREFNSTIKTIGIVIFQCCVAWMVAFAVYQLACLVA